MSERVEKKSSEGLPESARPEETYKTSDPRPHLVEMDGLRGMAILGTLLGHITIRWGQMTATPLYVPWLGVNFLEFLLVVYLAVPAFFLLSGYLLTWTEEKRKRRGSYSVLNYAKRRVLRIVPAYYVAMVVVVLVWPIVLEGTKLGQRVDPSFEALALHLTFLHDFYPYQPIGLDPAWWSLTPEILFYAMLPFLVLKFRKLWQRAAILTLLVVVSLAARIMQAYGVFSLLPGLAFYDEANPMYFFPIALLYLFLVGMLLRMMVERRADAGNQPGRRQLLVASALTVVPGALVLMFPYFITQQEIVRSPMSMVAEAMVILIFASVLLGSPILKPLLRLRPLVFLGEISYSLFLLHNTVLFTTDSYLRRMVHAWLHDQGELMVWATFGAFAIFVVAVSVTLAYLSYRYIESPFMRIKPK